MGRPERPLNPDAGPVQRFAQELRALRDSAGRPSYRELARRAHYSPTALSEAAGGERLPSKAVLRAYVQACGGDVAAWEKRWEEVAAELEKAAEPEDDGPSPYLGLTTYEPRDADLFFGRAEVVARLCEKLAEEPFIAVFGASGSGKSSILRAGLLPAVWNGAVPGSDTWRTILLTPGRHPVEELAVHLGNALGISAGSIQADLTERPASVHVVVRQILAKGAAGRVLLMVDQFEEVFTLCPDERERAAFIDCLVGAAAERDGPARVVIGVRADFLARCAQYPALVDALRDRQVLVGPMDEAGLRAVIREPAARVGAKVEPRLVEAIVADAKGEPGALPLVSHALYETWRRRTGDTMTLDAYRRAGGVQGAIAQTAERVYGEYAPEDQPLVRDLFLRLTALGQGTEDTRRRVSRTELPDERVLGDLVASRLVVANEDTVEVAHEALIRSWPRLRGWLAEDREQLLAHRRLTDDAAEWERHGRDDGVLYRGARLAAWQDRDTSALNELELEFLEAGRRLAAAERRAARRRVRVAVTALVTAVVTLAGLTVVALDQADRATAEERLAFTRQLVADARAQLRLDPELALLLARRAYQIEASEETEAALRQATLESRIRFVVHGHDRTIHGVAYSPDGRHLATSGRDGAIRVWRRDPDGALHDPIVLKGHEGEVWTPVFSPDGRLLAAGGQDGVVTLWDWASGRDPRRFTGHKGSVWCVAFSPHGDRIASAGDDGTIRFWNVDGTPGPVLRGHKERTLGVAFSPDGKRLASSSGDHTVRIWDLADKKAKIVLRGHQDSVEAVAFSPDGRNLATASTDGTVRVWDPRTPDRSLLLGDHDGTAEGVAYSRDGRRVVSTGNDGTVRIWDATRRSRPLLLRGHRGTAVAAAFGPDDRELTSVGEDGTARVWDAVEVGGPTILRGHEGPVWSAAVGPGGRVASVGVDGTVRVWDSPDPIVLRGHEGDGSGIAFSPDGRLLATTGIEDKTVKIWDLATRREAFVFRGHEKGVWTASFSPDGRRLATSSSDGTVRVWSMTGEPPIVLTGDQGAIRGAAFSPDGTRVAGAAADGTVRVWNASGAGTPKILSGHRGLVWSVAFSPDGRLLATGGNDGTVRIWPLDGRGDPVVRDGHQGVVWNVAFSPDGKLLVSSGNDGTARIWKTTGTGEPLVVQGFGASVEAVLFASNDRLVSTHDDGTVRVWPCQVCGPMDQVVQIAAKRVTRDLTDQERAAYLHEPA